MVFTVAIDGPAAAGKGTIARAVADRFGFRHLDTGLLYRAVGVQGGDPVAAARSLTTEALTRDDLRTLQAGQAASRVAVIPEVRAALVDFQRRFARDPQGAVLDGRDIGTVICPEAEVKLYVTASAEVRAHRRWLELGGDEAQVLAEVKERDARDMGRADAPLRPAPDAVVIDTSKMGIDEAVVTAIAFVVARLADTGPHLFLDASGWREESQMWDAICAMLEAPSWHGRNLDALWNSITGGLNGVEPPYHLIVSGAGTLPPKLSARLGQVEAVFSDALRQGVPARFTCHPAPMQL